MLDYAEFQAYPEPVEWLSAFDEAGFDAESVAIAVGEAFEDSESAEDVAKVLAEIGQAVLKALPAVLPVLGGAVGGPGGAAAGAAAGTLVGTATAAGARKAPPTGTRRRQKRRPPAAVLPQTPGSPAAAQLLALFFRPEVLQALWAMALGQLGSGRIDVAGTPVPPDAFTNLIGVLADSAGAEYRVVSFDEGAVPQYLVGSDGELKGDIAVPEERAGVLWSMLHEAIDDTDDGGPFERLETWSDEGLDNEWWDGW
jgi:hypothetical protein